MKKTRENRRWRLDVFHTMQAAPSETYLPSDPEIKRVTGTSENGNYSILFQDQPPLSAIHNQHIHRAILSDPKF